jgi:hypothetical protein
MVVDSPIQGEHFTVVAPELSAVCVVRALDANDGLLAEEHYRTPPGRAQSLGTCP